MNNFKKIILATKNLHKIKEITACLKNLNLEISSFNDLTALPTIEETGKTFVENAYLKARETSLYTHTPCLADDSGLIIPALNGEPGVYSARYVGETATDEDRMQKVLKKMAGKKEREAHFECVLLLFEKRGEKENVIIGRGRVLGDIATSIRGNKGFGYDSIFIAKGFEQTFGELGSAVKNKLSHRKLALDDLIKKMGAK